MSSPAIEIGDLDRGYRAIDISGTDARLYSLTCPLYFGLILVAIPKYTKGKLTLVAKNKDGQPLTSKVEALDDPRDDTPDLLPPSGTMDRSSVDTMTEKGAVREIKEWQAIMDHLRAPSGQDSGRTAGDPGRCARRGGPGDQSGLTRPTSFAYFSPVPVLHPLLVCGW